MDSTRNDYLELAERKQDNLRRDKREKRGQDMRLGGDLVKGWSSVISKRLNHGKWYYVPGFNTENSAKLSFANAAYLSENRDCYTLHPTSIATVWMALTLGNDPQYGDNVVDPQPTLGAMRNLMTLLLQSNFVNPPYTEDDLEQYFLSIGALYVDLFKLRKAYGFLNTFDAYKPGLADNLIASCGINPIDFRTNADRYLEFINSTLLDLVALPIPMDFTVMKRWEYYFSNLFADSHNIKTGYIHFMPSLSYNVYQGTNPYVLVEAKHAIGAPSSNLLGTYATITNDIAVRKSVILSNNVFARISGDIRKQLDSFYTMSPITIGYRLAVIEDAGVKDQLRNAAVKGIPVPASFNLRTNTDGIPYQGLADSTGSKGFNPVCFMYSTSSLPYSQLFAYYNDNIPFFSESDVPSEEEILVSSRITTLHRAKGGVITPYNYNDSTNTWDAATLNAPSNHDIVDIVSYGTEIVTQISIMLRPYEDANDAYIYDYSAVCENNDFTALSSHGFSMLPRGWRHISGYNFAMLGDVDNMTWIHASNVNMLHHCSLQAEFAANLIVGKLGFGTGGTTGKNFGKKSS